MGILGRLKMVFRRKKKKGKAPGETDRLLAGASVNDGSGALASRERNLAPAPRKRRRRRRTKPEPKPATPSDSSSSSSSSSSSGSSSGSSFISSSSSLSISSSITVSGSRPHLNFEEKGKEEESDSDGSAPGYEYEYEDEYEDEDEDEEVSIVVADVADLITVWKACRVPARGFAAKKGIKGPALVGMIVEMTFPSVADVIYEVSRAIYVHEDGKLPLADDRRPLAPGQKYRTKHTLAVTGYIPVYDRRRYDKKKTPAAVEGEVTREGTTTVAVSDYDRKFFYPLGGKVQAGGPVKGPSGVLRGCGGGVHFFVTLPDAFAYGQKHCFKKFNAVLEKKTIRPAGPSGGR